MTQAFCSGTGQFLIALNPTRTLMVFPELHCLGACKAAHMFAAFQRLSVV